MTVRPCPHEPEHNLDQIDLCDAMFDIEGGDIESGNFDPADWVWRD